MKLSDFDYLLPKALIAQYPLKERDNARLLILDRKKGSIEHRIFKDITEYLKKEDLLVLNNTKVKACRIKARRLTGGKLELLLVKQKRGLVFEALIKPGRVRIGEEIIFNGGQASARISARNEVTFNLKDRNEVYKLGAMPLPPYIKREPEAIDNLYYQTVYAKEEGAIASPTAGLHFTEGLISKIESAGIDIAYVTLHVGYATFRPVKSEDITRHKMEPEYFEISDKARRLIKKAKENPKARICAVGTTSCRALEAYAQGKAKGQTHLFIYPGYKFKAIDCLLTNFHLPRTTLFMLVCAFAGERLIKKAYQEAIDKKYRFYSYGDAMLII
ncbi:MAG TPA: tRNA preQ1(34) S-adenosylmethionine ribosyltransferase-isomerase QueA [Candidatus Omnitrophota bacterium]|nr:tRNA preQ1(34) S-adenosylmethionine ribosyltransferase-isomerase QueA [Candidatus Omnitrophota bacterium]